MDKNKIINIATNNPDGLWVHKFQYRTEKLRKKCIALVKQGILVRDLEKQFDSRKHYIFSVKRK